jgi:hypothetical protein
MGVNEERERERGEGCHEIRRGMAVIVITEFVFDEGK